MVAASSGRVGGDPRSAGVGRRPGLVLAAVAGDSEGAKASMDALVVVDCAAKADADAAGGGLAAFGLDACGEGLALTAWA